MKSAWREYLLGDILTECRIAPDEKALAAGEVPIISKIRFSDGEILFRKATESKTNLISIKPGNLVISGINAIKGAIAIYKSDTQCNAAATIHYSAYSINEQIVYPRFLWFLLRTDVFREQLARTVAKGIKTELKANKFLTVAITLPDKYEQAEILQNIDLLLSKICRINSLREKAISVNIFLFDSLLVYNLKGSNAQGILSDVLTGKPRNGWSAKCDNNPEGTPVLSLSAVLGFTYNADTFKRTSLPTEPNAHYWLNPGDILISRSNTIELVGHASIYDGNPFPCIYPDLLMRLPIDKTKVNSKFLIYWLQSSIVRSHLKERAKGTSPTMKKINQGAVCSIPFPTNLTVDEQERIAIKLDNITTKILKLSSHSKASTAGLNLLLPSYLNRIFGTRMVLEKRS